MMPSFLKRQRGRSRKAGRPLFAQHDGALFEVEASGIDKNVFWLGSGFWLARGVTGTVYRSLSGPALKKVIDARTQPVDLDWLQKLTVQLCQIVSGMHNRGIAWRDVKPDNLICTGSCPADLQLKAVDFGDAVRIPADGYLYYDEAFAAGTLQYMAPETLEACYHRIAGADTGFGFLPVAEDWWSVGATLYEAATGQPLIPLPQSSAEPGGNEQDAAYSLDRLQFMLQTHVHMKEAGMAEVWQKLHQATGDALFVSFMQGLLVQDKEQRRNDDAIMQHAFMQCYATKCAQGAAVKASQPNLSTLSGPPNMDRLQTVPSMPHVLWDPEQAVCHTATGTIFRGWAYKSDWQPVFVKRCDLYSAGRDNHASAQQTAVHITHSALWLLPLRQLPEASWMPVKEFAFADNVQYTVLRPQGQSYILLKDYLAKHTAASSPQPRSPNATDGPHSHPTKADWTLIAFKLVQMLHLLHTRGCPLGGVLPDRILLHINEGHQVVGVSLLDDTVGLVEVDASSAPYVSAENLSHLKTGQYHIAAHSKRGEMWSLGVVLFRLCTGDLPFVCKDASDGAQARDSVLDQLIAWKTGFHDMEHPVRHSLAKVADPELSELILGLLHPDLDQRLSASAALGCPMFKGLVAAPLVCNLTAVASGLNALHAASTQPGAAASVSPRDRPTATASTADPSKPCQADAAIYHGSAADSTASTSASGLSLETKSATAQSQKVEKGSIAQSSGANSAQQTETQPCNVAPESGCDDPQASFAGEGLGFNPKP